MLVIWRVGKLLSSMPKIISGFAVDKACNNLARLCHLFVFRHGELHGILLCPHPPFLAVFVLAFGDIEKPYVFPSGIIV